MVYIEQTLRSLCTSAGVSESKKKMRNSFWETNARVHAKREAKKKTNILAERTDCFFSPIRTHCPVHVSDYDDVLI